MPRYSFEDVKTMKRDDAMSMLRARQLTTIRDFAAMTDVEVIAMMVDYLSGDDMYEEPKGLPTAQAVAREFCRVLRSWLGDGRLGEVIARNTSESNPDVCHSHDYCDANLAMQEAFNSLGYLTANQYGMVDDSNFDHKRLALWAEAWKMAKAAWFNATEI